MEFLHTEQQIVNANLYFDNIKQSIKNNPLAPLDSTFCKELNCIIQEHEVTIPTGFILYRARYFPRDKLDFERAGTQFEGYDEKESFVNLFSINGARMHTAGEHVLYAASDTATAITELNLCCGELSSIAEISILHPLRIADFSRNFSCADQLSTRYLSVYIHDALSKDKDEYGYSFPQKIASYCKSTGYDGIAYRSKYSKISDPYSNKGVNYAIFNYGKTAAISSKLYSTNNIIVDYSVYYGHNK